MKNNFIIENLDLLYPLAQCELEYKKDYELLIATVLSAQSTDKRVNMVTNTLFQKYDIFSLKEVSLTDLEEIIRPVGRQSRNAQYIKEIATRLVNEHNGKVPNSREFIESLPGVGRKVCNVVLSNLYHVPAFAVDTHVSRVSNRLGLVKTTDVKKIEQELMNYFPEEKWIRLHHQFVLFGRYICKSKNPLCQKCPFNCPSKEDK